jgi:glycogen operon protein
MPDHHYEYKPGSPSPLGATPLADGVNFSLYSEHATGVTLLLFDAHDSRKPFQEIKLDPGMNKTWLRWHVFVRGLRAGAHYAYRVEGPPERDDGDRFNSRKVLIDPYAGGNTKSLWDRNRALDSDPNDNVAFSMRSVVIDTSGYNWEGDEPLRRKLQDTIIYEMHVRGFTQSPSSGVQHPGTFEGIIERIPYLQELGVNAVELLPIFDFDRTDVLNRNLRGQPLVNYWGFSPIGFFAPESSYCVSPESASHLREFRDLVKALHKAGIEVILDVVFNHTAEGNHGGPVFSFKGIDNRTYYFLVPWDPRFYLNFSGCGNTFNCNHPIAQKLIVDCLRYWVGETHVDGFRFDAASVLTRDEKGRPNPHAPVVEVIALSNELEETKVIAEPWDTAVLQIGSFPGHRWVQWNACYRDDIRRYVKGEPGVSNVASRLAGSSDLFQRGGRLPVNSINFVTSHDGFTLNDLVSYNQKHNEDNGENNADGSNDNLSWNCGHEGDSTDREVEALRSRQIRNFATLLLLSQGVPMFVAGDEVQRTQKGNNNAYCQDNEISWFDWELVKKNAKLLRFWQLMIKFRKRHAALRRERFFTGAVNSRGVRDVEWHGTMLGLPGWDDHSAHALGMTLAGLDGGPDIHVMMNMWDGRVDDKHVVKSLPFQVPEIAGRSWYRAVDTARTPPEDIADPGSEPVVSGTWYEVQSRSVVVLVNERAKPENPSNPKPHG